MIRFGLASLALLATLGGAVAQERPYAPRLACQQVAALVAQHGAIVISTGPITYERVVKDESFCPVEETTAPFWTPSADNQQCFAGYRCRDKFSEGRDIN
jgi:hypothetical protein